MNNINEGNAAEDETSNRKPPGEIRRKVPLGQLILHPDYLEYQQWTTKFTYHLKRVKEISPDEMTYVISRQVIKVVEGDGRYFVVEGIRSWQAATSTLPPATKIQVIVAPSVSEDGIIPSLIRETIILQMLFRSSDAGAREIFDLFGELSRDKRCDSHFKRMFRHDVTKKYLAKILGEREASLYDEGKLQGDAESKSPNGGDADPGTETRDE